MSMEKRRGFAVLSPERMREIASLGGKAAHNKDNGATAHEFTTETARDAGKKGARALLEKYGREHMRKIGRVGGRMRKEKLL